MNLLTMHIDCQEIEIKCERARKQLNRLTLILTTNKLHRAASRSWKAGTVRRIRGKQVTIQFDGFEDHGHRLRGRATTRPPFRCPRAGCLAMYKLVPWVSHHTIPQPLRAQTLWRHRHIRDTAPVSTAAAVSESNVVILEGMQAELDRLVRAQHYDQ